MRPIKTYKLIKHNGETLLANSKSLLDVSNFITWNDDFASFERVVDNSEVKNRIYKSRLILG